MTAFNGSLIVLNLDVSGEGLSLIFRRWATKKTGGSTKNGRDSLPKNLGVKKFGGEVSGCCFETKLQWKKGLWFAPTVSMVQFLRTRHIL